ncbi:MAG: type III-B CRISPR module RAMP protein Cmr4 [Fusobacteriaceae bacterium]|jgi:CRISPR-associated protein Cmr4|nr:type III-B CRISPR module RAMP protein Cmr4 [Fusobacteriaceae bacterium]
MRKYIFKIECVTNLHVGSGEANYNIIDNEVQKDVVLTDVPAIYSSGVKGALREHFSTVWNIENNITNKNKIKKIFGNDDGESTQGTYKFFGAKLIARPLRVSSGNKPYLLTTSNDILKDFSDFMDGLGLSNFFKFSELKLDKSKFGANVSGFELEGEKVVKYELNEINAIKKLIGNDFAIANSLRDYDLPVVARNVLENGKSKNLWYEEIVPHKSIFYSVVMIPDNEEIELKFKPDEPVQFGGNATIGQGYTKITQVYPAEVIK